MSNDEWIEAVVSILVNPPHQFKDRYANSYAKALADEYFDLGFEPQEALKETGFYRLVAR